MNKDVHLTLPLIRAHFQQPPLILLCSTFDVNAEAAHTTDVPIVRCSL